jgi:hypothetical protein
MATRLHPGDGARIIPFDQLAPMLRAIPSLPRPVLARLTEKLIERLDELDGDCDLEPEDDRCLAGDDGCGFYRDGARSGWGAREDAAYLPLRPVYALDQSTGPINLHDWGQDEGGKHNA